MNFFQALILGIVQGLSEFLPISSSGHLIIFPSVFGWEVQSLAFDTTLHLGTALALVIYFWKDIGNIILRERKLGYYIIVGTIPAGVAGFFLEDIVENTFRGVFYVVMFLLLGSILMFVSEKVGNWAKKKDLDLKKSLLIGVFQALALLPGISRSGSTISGGMLFGLDRENAARFSFLLSIPVVIGAGLFKISKSAGVLNGVSFGVLSVGFMSSFVAGMFAIEFMLRFLREKSLKLFIVYRLLLVLFLYVVLGL
jgi:undecaprenyl-diphosphatase